MSKLLEQINKTKEYILGDICLSSGGGTPSTTIQEYWNGDIPWLTPTEISNVDFCFVSDTKRKITQKGLESSSAKLMPEYSILMSSRANIGDVVINTVPMTTNQGFINMIPNKELVDLYYFSYWLRTRKNYFIQVSTGSTFLELSKSTFREIPINLPDLSTQKKIAKILSAYDAKIENNNFIIKKLEATAQTLFDEWFVNFRFPGYEKLKFVDSEMGEIPEGWEIKNLNDISDIVFGFNFKSNLFNEDGLGIPVVRIRDVLSGTTKTSSPEVPTEEYKIKSGDLLIGMDGTFHCAFWYSDGAFLNQRVARVRSELPGYFIYEAIREQLNFLQKTIIGATVGHLSNGDIRGFKIIIPKDITLLKVFESITNQALNLRKENVSLKSQRDRLLAKLI